MKRINFDLDKNIYKEMRQQCIKLDLTIKEFCTVAIKEKLKDGNDKPTKKYQNCTVKDCVAKTK